MRKGDIAVERGIAFCVMQNGKLRMDNDPQSEED